jgi:hypothetical protein
MVCQRPHTSASCGRDPRSSGATKELTEATARLLQASSRYPGRGPGGPACVTFSLGILFPSGLRTSCAVAAQSWRPGESGGRSQDNPLPVEGRRLLTFRICMIGARSSRWPCPQRHRRAHHPKRKTHGANICPGGRIPVSGNRAGMSGAVERSPGRWAAQFSRWHSDRGTVPNIRPSSIVHTIHDLSFLRVNPVPSDPPTISAPLSSNASRDPSSRVNFVGTRPGAPASAEVAGPGTL